MLFDDDNPIGDLHIFDTALLIMHSLLRYNLTFREIYFDVILQIHLLLYVLSTKLTKNFVFRDAMDYKEMQTSFRAAEIIVLLIIQCNAEGLAMVEYETASSRLIKVSSFQTSQFSYLRGSAHGI